MQEEEARTRGTPVTIESFKSWKAKFDADQARRKQREEAERLVGLTPKEREEWKRMTTRLSGENISSHKHAANMPFKLSMNQGDNYLRRTAISKKKRSWKKAPFPLISVDMTDRTGTKNRTRMNASPLATVTSLS